MPRVVFSLPTRGRPDRIVDTVRRNLSCLSRPDSLIMVQVDSDDEETIRIASIKHPQLKWSIREREDTIAAKWNRALKEPADVYCCLGDDDPLCVAGADEKILKGASLFPDGIGFVYGPLANASFTGILCITRRMTEILGYIQPEHFPYWFCDHWTDDIARITGRISCVSDIRTDLKPGKTQELREPAWWGTWFDANYMIRRREAFRVIEHLDEPQWRKEMQRNFAPIVEYRSNWINSSLRASARHLEAWSGLTKPDARYLRVKQKAIDALPEILETLAPHEQRYYHNQLIPPNIIPNLLPNPSLMGPSGQLTPPNTIRNLQDLSDDELITEIARELAPELGAELITTTKASGL